MESQWNGDHNAERNLSVDEEKAVGTGEQW